MDPALRVINNGAHSSYGAEGVLNSFGANTPKLRHTGIAGQSVTLIDTQKYNIDIFNDMKTWKPQEYPLLTVLTNATGKMISQYFDIWNDDYEGDGWVDIMLDELRLRDSIGTGTAGNPGDPIPVGNASEIGGELFFQKAFTSDTAAIGATNAFEDISADDHITITALGSSVATKKAASYLETGLVPGSTNTDKKLLSLGFARTNLGTGVTQYQDLVGQASEVIRKVQNTLAVREYVTSALSLAWNELTATDSYSMLYTPNTSKQVFMVFDDLEIAEVATGSVGQDHKIQTVAAVDQFIFDKTMSKFVLVLNFDESNLDMFASGTIQSSGTPTADNYYQVVSIGTTEPTIGGVDLHPGDLFKATGTFVYNSATIMTVPNALLLEEVNTSAYSATDAATDRIFGANTGSDGHPAGWSRLARHMIINIHDDVPGGVAENVGFGSNEKGGYVFGKETHINNLQIHTSKTWSVTTMRKGTDVRFQDDVAISRDRHLAEYKRDWTNISLRGKMSDNSASDGFYNGTMSGFLDYEKFPIKYMKNPLPFSGGAIDTSGGGRPLKNWLAKISKGLNAGKQVGAQEGHTLFVSLDVLDWLSDANAFMGTVDGNKLVGSSFQAPPPSTITMGLQIFEFKTIHGTLRFIHEPALDIATSWKVPRFLFPNSNGKIIPRFLILAIDKNFIEFATHKSRVDKVYGNLQANDNPFISTEGISGAHTLKVRFPKNHAIIDITPNT